MARVDGDPRHVTSVPSVLVHSSSDQPWLTHLATSPTIQPHRTRTFHLDAVPFFAFIHIAAAKLLQPCHTKLTITISATVLRADAPAHRDAPDAHTPLAAAHAAETTTAAVNVARDPRRVVHRVQGIISHTELAAEEVRLEHRKTRTT